jgi:hypothetical protein
LVFRFKELIRTSLKAQALQGIFERRIGASMNPPTESRTPNPPTVTRDRGN